MRFFLQLLFIVSTLTFSSCQKDSKATQIVYPEDEGISRKTPRERLQASWRIYSYQFKGQEIIHYLDTINSSKAKMEELTISYTYDGAYKQWLFRAYNSYFNFQSEEAFNIDDPYYINFSLGANVLFSKWFITPFQYTPSNNSLVTKWTITKLYDTDLNLVLNTDSGEYKMFLRKK